MPKLLAMFHEGEALALHAAHTSYRGRPTSMGRTCWKAACRA
ncbi:hypothetical protein ACFQX4_02600 [Roseomonas sp. GCM10028921]